MKSCSRCKEVKLKSEFYKLTRAKDGLRSTCKACDSSMAKSWSKEHREKHGTWAKANPEKALNAKLKRQYGITLEQRNSLILSQKGQCKICEDILDMSTKTVVDHCHKNGHVRGILCKPCNTMLGFSRDNPQTLIRAAEYLKNNIKTRGENTTFFG